MAENCKILSSEVLKGDLAWRVCLKEEGILKVYGKQPDQFSEYEALSKIVRKLHSVTTYSLKTTAFMEQSTRDAGV